MTAPAKPNAELAYRVLDQIDAHPETWNQHEWDCGSAACFAGWAVRLSGGVAEEKNRFTPTVVEGPRELVGLPVDEAAIEVLGTDGWTPSTVEVEEQDWLFSASNDREDLGRIVTEIFGPRPDSAVFIVDNGPAKPPYGSPERAVWDAEHDVAPNAGSAS